MRPRFPTFFSSKLFAFILLFAAMIANIAFMWPAFYNFVALSFRDQGSFATLEDLLHKGFRLGVDLGYSYGLLGIWLQHVSWLALGGPAYQLFFVFVAIYLALTALLWAHVWQLLGSRPAILISLVLLVPWIAMYQPVLAYELMQLCVMFGLVCILRNQLSRGLVFAVLGWLAVPSITIVFALLICCWICIQWYRSPSRTIGGLVKPFLPAAAVGLFFAVILTIAFGFDSFVSSLLPKAGAAMYKALNFGVFGLGRIWLHPDGANLGYYLGTGVGWWLLGALLLSLFAARAIYISWQENQFSPRNQVIISGFVLIAVFIAVAFGTGGHTMYCNPIIVMCLLVGLSTLSVPIARQVLLFVFVGAAVVGMTASVRGRFDEWRHSHRSALTAGLYAPDSFEQEWKPILAASSNQKVLILSYGNGLPEFCPNIETSDSWFLLPGLVKDAEKARLLKKIRDADIVVEERQGPLLQFIDHDPDVQAALRAMPESSSGYWFRVHVKPG